MKGIIAVKSIKANNTKHFKHNDDVVAVRWNSSNYTKRNGVCARNLIVPQSLASHIELKVLDGNEDENNVDDDDDSAAGIVVLSDFCPIHSADMTNICRYMTVCRMLDVIAASNDIMKKK